MIPSPRDQHEYTEYEARLELRERRQANDARYREACDLYPHLIGSKEAIEAKEQFLRESEIEELEAELERLKAE